MKNSLIYCINNNEQQVKMMVNSINSFCHFNEKLLSTIDVIIVPLDKQWIETNQTMKSIDNRINIVILDKLTQDYSNMLNPDWVPTQTFYRYEIFNNPLFLNYDNVLYIDTDTEFVDSVQDLFNDKTKPVVYMVQDPGINGRISSTYCNAGVMLVTPKLIGETTLKQINSELVKISTGTRYWFADQDALNIIFNKPEYRHLLEIKESGYNLLMNRWNDGQIRTMQLCGLPVKIFHWSGDSKSRYEFKYI